MTKAITNNTIDKLLKPGYEFKVSIVKHKTKAEIEAARVKRRVRYLEERKKKFANQGQLAMNTSYVNPDVLPADRIVYKKVYCGKTHNQVVAKLYIPEDAQVVMPNPSQRCGDSGQHKCRASKVIVLELQERHTGSTVEVARSGHVQSNGERVKYRVGQAITPDVFNANPILVCAGGIHFFTDRGLAERY